MSPNPYAPPRAKPVPGPVSGFSPTAAPARPLASQNRRLFAFLVDTAITLLVASALSRIAAAVLGIPQSVTLVQLGFVPTYVVQWCLLATRGQTLGKIPFHLRVVRLDGTRVGFVDGVVKRAWPVAFVQLLMVVAPAIGTVLSWLTVVDALFIFAGDQRRCLHDRIAGTIVVQE